MMAVVSARKAATGRSKSKSKNKRNCKPSPLATSLDIGELPAASTTRQKEGITMTKMGERNYLLGIKPIVLFVLTTFPWGS
jgi:hypothetical protein